MQNKKNIILIVGFVILAALSFYAGTAYSGSKNKTNLQTNNFNPSRQGGQSGQFSQGRGGRVGGGNVFGQIIAKDANSITVQLNVPSGPNTTGTTTNTGTGSKIVLYTNTTTVAKTVSGTSNDLAAGTEVSVQGIANPDGSVSAQTISIRPTQINPPKN